MKNRIIILFILVALSVSMVTTHGKYFLVNAQSSLSEVEEWKVYDSPSLGFTIEYPSNTPIKEEAASRFDADTQLEFGSGFEGSDFWIIPKIETKETLDFPLSVLADFILKNNVLKQKPEPNTYIKLIEGVTPLSLPNQNDVGVSYLISFIDTLSNKAKLVGNTTFISHGDVTYRFNFLTPQEKYDDTTQIFNHMIKSIKWSDSNQTIANNQGKLSFSARANQSIENDEIANTRLPEKITLQLNSAEFITTGSSDHQVKILVDYETNDFSLVNSNINGVLEISEQDGTPIKTTSYPDGFTITESGLIQFASTIDDEDIESVDLKVKLTDIDKTVQISNVVETTVILDQSNEDNNEED